MAAWAATLVAEATDSAGTGATEAVAMGVPVEGQEAGGRVVLAVEWAVE